MNGIPKTCAWCGAPFFGDKRHKYCSEICAGEAHRQQARESFRIRYYVTHREAELERQHKRYRDNTEKEKARSAEWARQNLEHRREYKRNWDHARKEATNHA